MVNGYPVLVTNYIDADSIGFGVFSNAAIGQFGDMDLVIDPYTGAKSNVVNFVLNTDYDIVVARSGSLCHRKEKKLLPNPITYHSLKGWGFALALSNLYNMAQYVTLEELKTAFKY